MNVSSVSWVKKGMVLAFGVVAKKVRGTLYAVFSGRET